MKQLILLLLIGFSFVKIEAQKMDLISVSAGYGQNNLSNLESLACAASYRGDGNYSIGMKYKHFFNRNLAVFSGLAYSHYRIIRDKSYYSPQEKQSNIQVLSIPMNIEIKFLKYFILGGGAFANFEIGRDESITTDIQSGIGANLYTGISVKYRKYIIDVAPYLSINTLVPFKNEKHHYRLFDSGIKLNFGYIL